MSETFLNATGLSYLIGKIKTALSGKAPNKNGTFYGTCDTAAATAAKVVTLSDGTGFTLAAGSKIAVKFTYTNSANTPTLNVQGTGAKNIYVNGDAVGSNAGRKAVLTGTVLFVYDGTQYHMANNYYDSNSNTWRGINVNGTALLGTATNTGNVNFKSGTNVTVSGSGTDITIAATDTTYSSKAAASGGTDLSLVTTGEKYTWNNKTSNTGTVTKVTAGSGLSIGTTAGGNFTTEGTINHTSSITAGTVGTSSATSGSTLAVPYVTYNATGHITATGTHTHTVTGFAASSHTHNYAGSASAGGPADNIAVTTTAPTANNTSGLKIAYLTSEPSTKYSGWLYLISE